MSYAYGMVAPSAATMTSPDRLNRLPSAQATLIRLGGQTRGATPPPPPAPSPDVPLMPLIGGSGVQQPQVDPADTPPSEDMTKTYVMYGLVAIAVVGIGWYFVSKRGA